MKNEIALSKDEKNLLFAALFHDIGKPKARIEKELSHSIEGAEFVKDLEMRRNLEMLGVGADVVADLILNHHKDETAVPQNTKLLHYLKLADGSEASGRKSEKGEGIILEIGDYINKIRTNIPLIRYGLENYSPESELKIKEITKKIKDVKSKNLFLYTSKIKTLINIYLGLVQSQEYKKEGTEFIRVSTHIPLSTHLLNVAALAISKYRHDTEEGEKEDELLWISGRLNHIQSYIFKGIKNEDTDKNATKRIRGRSFIVSILSKLIAYEILYNIDLPPTNLVASAGGNFIIIAPNTKRTKDKLKETIEKINKTLWEEYKPLYLSVFTQEFSSKKIKIDESKFYEVQKANYKDILKYINEKNNSKLCKFCRTNPIESDEKCRQCKIAEDIGKEIPRKHLISINRTEKTPTEGNYIVVGDTCYQIKFVDSPKECNEHCILILNQETAKKIHEDELTRITDFILLNNYVYEHNGITATFEEIADKKKDGERGYLSVIKIDFDNMGQLFRKIFSISNSDEVPPSLLISKYQLLSEIINLFLAFDLYRLLNNKKAYVVYAGGDDITIVSSPKEAIIGLNDKSITEAFIEEFDRTFNKDTSRREFTFSGGITIINDKFPLARAIEIAEELLENSKKAGKNRITLIEPTQDSTIKIKEVDESVCSIINATKRLIEFMENEENNKEIISSSTLMKIKMIRENNPFDKQEGYIVPTPLLNYIINRNVKKEYREEIKKIITNEAHWKHISLIIRLTLLWKKTT